ncbi:hypothetical protein F4802DRAFT_610152 [Xylaria palmicola]|nr:hypothetical protein F4802DRAFT_610152 [Xylaria palmicola]
MEYGYFLRADEYVDKLYRYVRDDEIENWLENAKSDLTCENGMSIPSVLHSILHNSTIFQKLPAELLKTILSNDPTAILMPFGGRDGFLTELININFNHDQGKTTKKTEITLYSLGEKACNTLHNEDPTITHDHEEPGAKCIQAAFSFNFAPTQRQGPLPIPMDLIQELVKLATSGMLKGKKEDNGITPLQRTVDYQLALHDREGQLQLARLLLDKCEESIWDRVAKGTMLALPRSGQRLPNEASVYGWHQFTQAHWQRHVGANIKERRPSPFNRGTTTTGITNNSNITLDMVRCANVASSELLKELGLRFLRSTLNDDLGPQRKEFVSGGESGMDGVVTDEDVLEAFFGKHDRKYYFTLDIRKKEGYGTIPKQMIDSFFQRYNYNAVLRHVTLCRVNIDFKEQRGRQISTDQLYFLRWLRARGVEKILKVTVDDMEKPHRDDEIEEILADSKNRSSAKSFNVEILDWRKPDLCPEMIEVATPLVRELHLQWSGNNVVLRGWSEPEGLPRLKWLKKVYLYYELTHITEKRTKRNVNSFIRRIQESRDRVRDATMATEGAENIDGLFLPIKPWFKNTREFVDLVPDLAGADDDDVEKPAHTFTDNFIGHSTFFSRVKVALIDDGVDVLESLHMHYKQFLPGRSFDTSRDGPLPEHSSVSGHGNFMAKSILRVCPNALIIPYRLKTIPGIASLTPQPEPGSAAKDSYKQGISELKKVVSNAKDAKKRIPLMFCAMRDDGTAGAEKKDLPAAMESCQTFRIGAADSTGQAWNKLSYSYVDKETMYLFPGVDIRDVLSLEPDEHRQDTVKMQKELTDKNGFTGSSIATALAAGLAALLLHCTRLGVFFTKRMREGEIQHFQDPIETQAISKNGEFDRMRSAFDKLCQRNPQNLKYANPGDKFQKAIQSMRVFDNDGGDSLRLRKI